MSSAHAGTHAALVIGNTAYQHTRVLPNATNDSRVIAALLKRIGFDVSEATNLAYQPMREAIRAFGRTAQAADVAVVYYAGHGLEVGGENYLVPTDARLATDADLEYEALTLASLLEAVRGRRKLSLVILDACRNNPLADRIRLRTGVTRSVSRGLARVEPSGDILVAFAAKAGTPAKDGAGINSPYAEALLEHLPTPGIDVRLVMGRVRDFVLEATNREQEPYIYGSLGGKTIALVPSQAPSPAATPPAKSVEPRLTVAPRLVPPGRCTGVRVGSECIVPGSGRAFKDCPECPQMVVVPAGEFLMGSPDTEQGRSSAEGPQHRVRIGRPLAIGKYEVTVKEYEQFVAATSGVADGGGCAVWTAYGHRFEKDRSFGNPAFSQLPSHPVVCVSWQAAVTYTNWLTTKAGKKYRLLSEAEWEYAARANRAGRYYFGDSEAELCKYANGADRTSAFLWGNHLCSDGAGVQTAEVGTYLPNAFGLHDVLGNVWEWLLDCAQPSYAGAPSDGSPWVAGDCKQRAIRGGSWDNGPKDMRLATRGGHPLLPKDNIGFRVAREID